MTAILYTSRRGTIGLDHLVKHWVCFLSNLYFCPKLGLVSKKYTFSPPGGLRLDPDVYNAAGVFLAMRRGTHSSPIHPTSLRSHHLRHSGRCPGYSGHMRTGTPPRCRWLSSHLKLHRHADMLNRCWKRWCSSWLSEALWSFDATLLSLSETIHEMKQKLSSTLRQWTHLHGLG